jgi:hypothetical protein
VHQHAVDAALFVYSSFNAGYIAVNARMMGNELEKMKKVTDVPKWRCYTGIFLEEWRKATKNKVFFCFVVSIRP